MTMPASGTITFAQLQTEFGGANPISLSEYYNGGAYVSNGAVPSSGAISLSAFYGLSAVVPAACSPTSGTIDLPYPTPNGVTANSTVTFAGGGTRTISFTSLTSGTVTWRKNGGTYTTAALSMSTGDYFNFRFVNGGVDEFASMDVFDSVAPATPIYLLAVSRTGSP